MGPIKVDGKVVTYKSSHVLQFEPSPSTPNLATAIHILDEGALLGMKR